MKNSFKIIFMGTPDFAIPSLDSLYKSQHNLCCVVTAADKKQGRGLKVVYSPVKNYCLKNTIKVIQPENFHNQEFLNEIIGYKPDIIVVVAFKILPKKLWEIPKLGTINIHASILPNLRGAAPINWAIINGLKKTGLTSFFINEGVDTGDIIKIKEIKINEDDNFGSLYEKLRSLSGNFILDTIDEIQKVNGKPQVNTKDLLTAPKLNKENTKINWLEDGKKIVKKIRGLSPIPGAWSIIKDSNKIIKIYDSLFHELNHDFEIGKMYIESSNKLMVAVNKGAIEILSLKIEGKKRISGLDYINGLKNKTIKLI